MSSWKLDYESSIKPSEVDFSLPKRLILGAGPANFSPRVINALTSPTTGSICDELYQAKLHIKEMLKYVFQTKNECTLAMQLTGTGGIEVILNNVCDPGEKVIIAVSGIWGERTVTKAQLRKLDVVQLTSKPGEIFELAKLEKEIIKHKPVLLFLVHGESSGGTTQPLEGLGSICHKYDCLLAVDAVVSLGGVPLYTDRWAIDCVIAATQKAIGAPAGIALLTFSPRAMERVRNLKHKPPFYFDVLRSADAWKCYGTAKKYHYTYNSHMISAVREALAQLVEEGLENAWERHEKNAMRFWDGIEKLGLKNFVSKKEFRLWTVTCICIPSDIKGPVLIDYLLKEHNVVVSVGIGPTLGVALRIGFMGYNSRSEIVDKALTILKDALEYCRSEKSQNHVIYETNDVM